MMAFSSQERKECVGIGNVQKKKKLAEIPCYSAQNESAKNPFFLSPVSFPRKVCLPGEGRKGEGGSGKWFVF